MWNGAIISAVARFCNPNQRLPVGCGCDPGKLHSGIQLTSLIGAVVEVTMEIQARVPDGILENVARTVSEECKPLKFQSQAFEKE